MYIARLVYIRRLGLFVPTLCVQSFECTAIGAAECYSYHENIVVHVIKIQVDSLRTIIIYCYIIKYGST